LRANGIPSSEDLIVGDNWRMESAYHKIGKLLHGKHSPTAVIGITNFLAVGALHALRKAGIRVPEEMSVVCFDDIPVASAMFPFLTVMAQSPVTMGRLAAQLLFQRIEGDDESGSQHVILKPKLVLRRSCSGPSKKPLRPRTMRHSSDAGGGYLVTSSDMELS
jgi:LacI family transcriptional regulator